MDECLALNDTIVLNPAELGAHSPFQSVFFRQILCHLQKGCDNLSALFSLRFAVKMSCPICLHRWQLTGVSCNKNCPTCRAITGGPIWVTSCAVKIDYVQLQCGSFIFGLTSSPAGPEGGSFERKIHIEPIEIKRLWFDVTHLFEELFLAFWLTARPTQPTNEWTNERTN